MSRGDGAQKDAARRDGAANDRDRGDGAQNGQDVGGGRGDSGIMSPVDVSGTAPDVPDGDALPDTAASGTTDALPDTAAADAAADAEVADIMGPAPRENPMAQALRSAMLWSTATLFLALIASFLVGLAELGTQGAAAAFAAFSVALVWCEGTSAGTLMAIDRGRGGHALTGFMIRAWLAKAIVAIVMMFLIHGALDDASARFFLIDLAACGVVGDNVSAFVAHLARVPIYDDDAMRRRIGTGTSPGTDPDTRRP